MKIMKTAGALAAAGMLLFAVAGTAMASTDLLAGQVGNTLGSFTNNCDFGTAPANAIGIQFNLTQTNDTDGSLDATYSGGLTSHNDHVDKTDGKTIKWYVWLDGATADTTIDSATTSADGKNLVISHVCFGASVPTPTPTPTQTATVPTQTPNGGGGGNTNQPPTDLAAGSTSQSGPTDTAWLLVVALGVLLASVVVLTPSRAKKRS